MQVNTSRFNPFIQLCFLLFFGLNPKASADVVMDWNITARNLVVDSKLYTPPANRVMAIVHTSIHQSVMSVIQTQKYKAFNASEKDAAIQSAVASASFTSLMELLPNQQTNIKSAYKCAINKINNSGAKEFGVNTGQMVATEVLLERAEDGFDQPESYRPLTIAGKYVPTSIPAVPHWPQRKTWILDSASQFRPGPPPALNSKLWAKDLNEVKELGGLNSSIRTIEQTEIAQFWEATLPPIYHGVIHSVAAQKDRTVVQNAALFALITQATDDAMIAVFDAKYHYGLWRPITAIRNADIDNNDDTDRDASWTPFIPTPMPPEYPCAHCVVAGTVGAIIKSEMGDEPMPLLTTRSDTANNTQRSWHSVEAFVEEVSNARIYDGVHYRTSSEVGSAMGDMIGKFAVKYKNK